LTAEDRETLGSLLASSWHAFELGRTLDAAIVDDLGGGKGGALCRYRITWS